MQRKVKRFFEKLVAWSQVTDIVKKTKVIKAFTRIINISSIERDGDLCWAVADSETTTLY